jgi:hypothetical protein
LYALLVTTWKGCVSGSMPEPAQRPGMETGKVIWVGERVGPFFSSDDLERAELLFVGDSRLRDAILVEPFEEAGLGRTGVLWGGCAQLTEMLPAARSLGSPRVVVALSPLSIYTTNFGLAAEILRNPLPDIAPPDFESKLEEWKSSERAHLLQAGFKPGRIEGRLADFENMIRDQVPVPWRQRIDDRLARWADTRRQFLLRTIEPARWKKSWFLELDPSASNPVYSFRMQPETREPRLRTVERVATLLRELSSEGRVLAAVRLPIAPELLAIEETGFDSAEFVRLCELVGVPFLDYSRGDYRTRDGSHLTGPSALRFSRDLARELAQLGN